MNGNGVSGLGICEGEIEQGIKNGRRQAIEKGKAGGRE
jgi:hypothetical protein